jgi:phage shock protein PspC (stress-responsive transcriptional regulator)
MDTTTAANPAASNQLQSQARPLRRPADDRMLAGVAAGIARYLGTDATIVRIVFVALVFIGGAGLPLYLAGWLLIPPEGSEQSIAGEFIGSRRGGPASPAQPD